MKVEEIKCKDEEENYVSKDARELLKTDLEDSKKQKTNTGIFIGESTEKCIKNMGLDPKFLQLK